MDTSEQNGAVRAEPLGWFEPIVDTRIRGWARESNGQPAAVVVHVNGTEAAVLRPRSSRPWTLLPKRDVGRFEAELQLRPGDRVGVVHASTGEALPGGLRTVVPGSYRPRIGIAAPVREEDPYLLEWLAYHRALGVETFLLGDNGGNDRTGELIEALDEAGLAHRVDWRGEKAFQIRFDLDAVQRMRGFVDVVSITDVDEFLRPLNGRIDIPSAAAELFFSLDVSAVALSLVVYGSSGRVEPGEGLVIERFTQRAPDDHVFHRTVKSLVRPERLATMLNPHQVAVTQGQYVNDRGEPVRWADAPAVTQSASWNVLRADHIVVKSYREFWTKARRGRVDMEDGIADRDEAFFRSRDRNDVVDPIPADFVRRTKLELARVYERLERYSTRWAALRSAMRP